jgi:phosphomannomutase
MGVDCILLNIETDGSFPAHGPDPSHEQAWKQMSEMVQQEKADFGIVFDGDGDRALICDEKGELMRPEYIWRFLLTIRQGNNYVHGITSSYLAHKLAAQLEGQHERSISLDVSKVGHLYITNAMKQHNADIGFEYSGHFYFKETGGVSSGLMTMIQMLNASSVLPYSMNTFTSLLPTSFRAEEVNVVFSPKRIRALVSALKKQYKSDKVDVIDGISVNREAGWFNVRPSNTADIIRINIEGETIKEVNTLKKDVLRVVKNTKY